CMCGSCTSCTARLSGPSSQSTCTLRTATARSSNHPPCKTSGTKKFIAEELQAFSASLLVALAAYSKSDVGVDRVAAA
ncbi:MAG: hypothetical protein ACREBA_06260, partial [Nitrosotalea sp.]